VHEGHHLEPACRDVEALLLSSQERVSGEVKLLFRAGSLFVEGVTSPSSLLAASRGVYGEAAGEWSGADAAGFSKLLALPGAIHARAGRNAGIPSAVAARWAMPELDDLAVEVDGETAAAPAVSGDGPQ
jgi:argininosuccinate synthase